MDYAHLGRSGLRVSRLCLGTMNFGKARALVGADRHVSGYKLMSAHTSVAREKRGVFGLGPEAPGPG